MKLLFLFLTFLSFVYPLSNEETSVDPEIAFMDKVEKNYKYFSVIKNMIMKATNRLKLFVKSLFLFIFVGEELILVSICHKTDKNTCKTQYYEKNSVTSFLGTGHRPGGGGADVHR